jgi:hypothetical protein
VQKIVAIDFQLPLPLCVKYTAEFNGAVGEEEGKEEQNQTKLLDQSLAVGDKSGTIPFRFAPWREEEAPCWSEEKVGEVFDDKVGVSNEIVGG